MEPSVNALAVEDMLAWQQSHFITRLKRLQANAAVSVLANLTLQLRPAVDNYSHYEVLNVLPVINFFIWATLEIGLF